MKRLFVFSWLTLLMVAVIAIFWYSDFIYRLPTPVPASYIPVPIGSKVVLPSSLPLSYYPVNNLNSKNRRPMFLHFFNPDCPCSRFNMDHVRKIIESNRSKADFCIVLVTIKDYSAAEIQERFGIDVPVIKDDSLSARYGVYSTPQAVIIGSDNELYYRGNYNRSRYCTDKKTNYAEIALTNLLNNEAGKSYDVLALKAYGCELPGCNRQ